MSATFSVQLHKLHFSAAHGLYEEEKLVGNEFEVNLSMVIDAPEKTLTKIEDTINYAEVHRITKEIFLKPTPLLETLAMEIAGAVKKEFSFLKSIQIQIIKLHPPITGFTGSVSVSYHKDFTV
ncbi:MAG: dihydroneopterin aldolase [Chitinophagaceae bacterium]|nr:MAG: dihydroneopterin aldolase [Chitinophagaceae bacterium]